MSTVSDPRHGRNLGQAQTRVRSPLASLRGLIRAYVSVEGAAVSLLYVVCWFWIAMILDYGLFKLSTFGWVQYLTGGFTIDWVQILPWGLRCGTLVLVLAGLLAVVVLKVALRLFREFSDAALALVLERRFPKELGDRLITAVELSDPQLAATYGYSPDLVEENIHQAAERVEHLPVKEVFNWGRLYRYGILAAVLSVGLYLSCAVGFAAVRLIGKQGKPLVGWRELNEVSSMVIERDVLLRDIIWPRKTHLQIVEVKPDQVETHKVKRDEEGTLFVGKGKSVSIRVRAWKYVLADNQTTEGWRLLTWADLQNHPEVVGSDLPLPPEEWQARDPDLGLTVDEVELRLARFEPRNNVPDSELSAKWNLATAQGSGWRPLQWSDLTRARLGGLNVPALPGKWDPKAEPVQAASEVGLLLAGTPFQALAREKVGPHYLSLSVDEAERHKGAAGAEDVRAVFDRLERLVRLRETLDQVEAWASEPANSRTVRKLLIPPQVQLRYVTRSNDYNNTLQKAGDNEYVGSFGELRESIRYRVRAEDYYTAWARIEAVELPQLESLKSEEERPAGRYYRAWDDQGKPRVKALDLRGKRQLFQPVSISVSGEASEVKVPAGTRVTLTAKANKPLEAFSISTAGRSARKVLNMAAAVPLLGTGCELLSVGYLMGVRQELVLPSDPNRLDDRTFQTTIEVNEEHRFVLEFTDTDGETGKRTVVLTPQQDAPPRIREFAVEDVIRRTKDAKSAGEVYMVAVGARIPFRGTVRDDNGLSRVRYAYTVVPSDFLVDKSERSRQVSSALGLLLEKSTRLAGSEALTRVIQDIYRPASTGQAPTLVDLPAFHAQVRGRKVLQDKFPELMELPIIQSRLKERVSEPFRTLLQEYKIEADDWTREDKDPNQPRDWVSPDSVPLRNDFGLWTVRYNEKPLHELAADRIQRRYQIDLWLEAEDTNVEGELDKNGQPIPGKGRSIDTLTFVIVPENELLGKIGEEEDIRFKELREAYKPLPQSVEQIREVDVRLSAKAGVTQTDLNGVLARAATLDEVLMNSQQATKGVLSAYERILKEMRLNQLRDDLVKRVFIDIVQPLREIDGVRQGSYARAREMVQALKKELEAPDRSVNERQQASQPRARQALEEMEALRSKLAVILDKMQQIGTINDLIALLHSLEQAEEKQETEIKRVRDDLIRKILEGETGK